MQIMKIAILKIEKPSEITEKHQKILSKTAAP